ncbi:MAG: catalase [Archangiaceae bacterium]|nr:catalase [Archangiaceae bacterium]
MATPSTDWKEVVSPGEEARFLGYAEYLRDLQRKRRPNDRGLHVKANLGLEAELVVDQNLPEIARHGLGAKPGKYRAYVRFSNGGAMRAHDKANDLRGFAVKVVGVEGKKVIPGLENARTQDFLCINHPSTAVRDADEFLAIVRAMQSPLLLVPKLVGSVGLGRAFSIVKRAAGELGSKITSGATTSYYSAAPLSWGPYAVKVSFQARAKPEAGAKQGDSFDFLGEELTQRVKHGPVVYDFRIQHYLDPQSTPLEAHDVEWQAPWLTIGTLTIPQQDAASPRGRKVVSFVEAASFDPWHALVEHRPLGNMMRARNHAYRLSTEERKAAPEPDGSEKFD